MQLQIIQSPLISRLLLLHITIIRVYQYMYLQQNNFVLKQAQVSEYYTAVC